jgi:hypothetical protein
VVFTRVFDFDDNDEAVGVTIVAMSTSRGERDGKAANGVESLGWGRWSLLSLSSRLSSC